MPRLPRSDLHGTTPYFHVICRGNNHATLFQDTEDFETFRSLAKKYCDKWHLQIFHYVLMTTHIHMEITVEDVALMSKALHGIQMIYCRYYQKKYPMQGHLWHNRFRSVPIVSEGHLIRCGRYIEINPSTAQMVGHPIAYPWSSYHFYANGQSDPLVTKNPMYMVLGETVKEQQIAYKEFIEEGLRQDLEPDQSLFEPLPAKMRRCSWL